MFRIELSVAVLIVLNVGVFASTTPAYYAGTDHYYQVVSASNLSWEQAKANAEIRTYNGLPGHLATITSSDENSFVRYEYVYGLLLGSITDKCVWLGGYRDVSSSAWKWVTPEAFSFANWSNGEPTARSYTAMVGPGGQGLWIAENNSRNAVYSWSGSYVVEYEPYTLTISNVTVSQRDDESKLVDIYYYLSHEEPGFNGTFIVSVEVSNDSGANYTVPATSFTGDVGSGIKQGNGRHIIWDCKKDLPGVFGSNYKIRIIANDGL